MKKFFLLIIFASCLLLTGCGNKSFILMKSEPFTAQNAQYTEQTFSQGERIYFAVVNPSGFKDDAVKIEIIEKNEKTGSMGYSIKYAKDRQIENSEKYFTDYFVLRSSGFFIMQVFELRRPDKCLARCYFRVK